jgi:phosphoglycerate dehydrogenase-like enzyme
VTPRADGPVRVLFGQPAFSEGHAWDEVLAHWPDELAGLAARVVIETVPHNTLGTRLGADGPAIHVVVPTISALTAPVIEAGTFGLIQQFGAGVDAIDLAAARRAGVWVANMPGLNAVHVAEHAIALLLALARRLPEAGTGFEPGHWGWPAGRSLSGTTACIVGLGAIGTAIATRLAAFGIHVTGVRRTARPPADAGGSAVPTVGPDQLHEVLAAADSVIIAASHDPSHPALIDRAALSAMQPGALLVNIARGALLDETAAVEAVRTGHLAGLAVDVFRTEPYPPDGPLRGHPRILATAHTAALTSGYFRDASRHLGDAIRRYTEGQPPEHLIKAGI